MLIERHLQIKDLLLDKSFFLFGPRTAGKSTLIRQQLAGSAMVIDLLQVQVAMSLASNPSRLAEMIALGNKKTIVIDEIQKLPVLLDEVQRLIELDKELRFLLTGSSVRKLRRAGVNLLAGRAWLAHLFPLVRKEIAGFDLDRYLRYGGLPAVYLSNNPAKELDAYVNLYMMSEVQNEGLVRKLQPFTRFLQAIALSNTAVINFTKLANDCQVAVSTARDHLQILEDTMLGTLIPAWTASKTRKATTTAKFYFFDSGVANTLAGIKSIDRQSDLYGKNFEHFIWMEIRAYLSYTTNSAPLRFWRARNGPEVDFLIGEQVAIEVKATSNIDHRDLRGLRALAMEKIFPHLYLVSHDPIDRKQGNFYLLSWQTFLDQLWSGKIIR